MSDEQFEPHDDQNPLALQAQPPLHRFRNRARLTSPRSKVFCRNPKYLRNYRQRFRGYATSLSRRFRH